jgi:hypothetical protein
MKASGMVVVQLIAFFSAAPTEWNTFLRLACFMTLINARKSKRFLFMIHKAPGHLVSFNLPLDRGVYHSTEFAQSCDVILSTGTNPFLRPTSILTVEVEWLNRGGKSRL